MLKKQTNKYTGSVDTMLLLAAAFLLPAWLSFADSETETENSICEPNHLCRCARGHGDKNMGLRLR